MHTGLPQNIVNVLIESTQVRDPSAYESLFPQNNDTNMVEGISTSFIIMVVFPYYALID